MQGKSKREGGKGKWREGGEGREAGRGGREVQEKRDRGKGNWREREVRGEGRRKEGRERGAREEREREGGEKEGKDPHFTRNVPVKQIVPGIERWV